MLIPSYKVLTLSDVTRPCRGLARPCHRHLVEEPEVGGVAPDEALGVQDQEVPPHRGPGVGDRSKHKNCS